MPLNQENKQTFLQRGKDFRLIFRYRLLTASLYGFHKQCVKTCVLRKTRDSGNESRELHQEVKYVGVQKMYNDGSFSTPAVRWSFNRSRQSAELTNQPVAENLSSIRLLWKKNKEKQGSEYRYCNVVSIVKVLCLPLSHTVITTFRIKEFIFL